ncbi:glutathione S-transferase [Orbus hercynius]|uniref:Glutathione S-transferase n=1 Tax=Orbus hercynius TaxID=593135 RepID=A0A495RBW9_9GAMM|nr:glutathione transferase GstA [Orbus hercynius]RKS84508.1 glutathione S-transferase [Orbus hercynius]
MKLYYSPGACSLTQHILLGMSGLPFTLEKVDLKTKKTEHNRNFLEISPKGQVPSLELEDGTILTENIAIAQYIADKVPAANLLAPIGHIERYQTLSWLSYVATELHKAYGPLFRSQIQAEKDAAIASLEHKYESLDAELKHRQFIASEHFTIADAYLYVVLRWRKIIPNLPAYPNIDLFMQRIEALPAVKKALTQEGL